jgi:REP element-mobilizing transposase RayT
MPRFPRSQLPAEGIYHVTARGVAGLPIFVSDIDRLDFLDLLTSIVSATAWKCHTFCLMSTHYHLVIETMVERLSRGMHQLNGRYALRFNRRNERRGHLFESRFSAWVVRDEAHFEATCRYVLDNALRAGLSTTDEPWPWAGRLAYNEASNSRTSSSPTSEKSAYDIPTA